MTLNDVMAVTLRYFTEFGKPALQKTICGRICARVYCIFSVCTMSSQRKFTFAISSPDEFLVAGCHELTLIVSRCLVPFHIHQMTQVNSYNGSVVMKPT